jgi:hypothetical protein
VTIHWNDELDARLIEMRNDGASYLKCSKTLGIYWQGCQQRGRWLGLPSIVHPLRVTKWTKQMEARLTALRANDFSWAEIAKELGIGEKVCRRRATRLGIDTSNPLGWTKNMDQRLIRYRSQGLSWNEIGKQMHLTMWSVRNRGRILGLVQHKTASAAKAAPEVGHPSNTAAASVAASVPSSSLPKLGGAAPNEPGAPAFLGRKAA